MDNITAEQLSQIITTAMKSFPQDHDAGLASGDWIAIIGIAVTIFSGLIGLVFWVGSIKTTIDGMIEKNKEQDGQLKALEQAEKESRNQLKGDIEKEFERNYGQHEDFYARDKATTSKVDTMAVTLTHIMSGIEEIKGDLKDMRRDRV